jgi:hydrophobic/amphiphilic exporter-1 (mainly G- bacteria), HAE1 family
MDQFEALRKGVTVYQMSSMLNQALEGTAVARLETGDEIHNLVLGYRKSDIATLEDLMNIGFYNASGSYLRLGDVARFSESLGPFNIPRENQQVIGYVRAQFHGQNLSSATREAMAALADIELPAGYTIREAASSQMADVFGELRLVLAVAALLVYLVMAAQFESFLNPLIIICSLPLAFTGGVIALRITGGALSIPAMIGAAVLAGILVNDGIIMVDFINQQRRIHGLPLHEAIIEGAAARLRPILMTTITTILGLVPLAMGLGEGSQLQAPMGLVIIGGQISGTLLLLIVIPAVYLVANRKS